MTMKPDAEEFKERVIHFTGGRINGDNVRIGETDDSTYVGVLLPQESAATGDDGPENVKDRDIQEIREFRAVVTAVADALSDVHNFTIHGFDTFKSVHEDYEYYTIEV